MIYRFWMVFAMACNTTRSTWILSHQMLILFNIIYIYTSFFLHVQYLSLGLEFIAKNLNTLIYWDDDGDFDDGGNVMMIMILTMMRCWCSNIFCWSRCHKFVFRASHTATVTDRCAYTRLVAQCATDTDTTYSLCLTTILVSLKSIAFFHIVLSIDFL